MAAHQFSKEYAASIDSFGDELKLTIARSQPLSQWKTRQEFETLALLGAVVMIVVISLDIGEHRRELLLAQIFAALYALARQGERRRASERAALLERADGYYSLRDLKDHRRTGVRIVDAYLNAVGLPLPGKSAVPVRYLASRLACRILGDLSRLGEKQRCEPDGSRSLMDVSLAIGAR